jgi:hypothetical protein
VITRHAYQTRAYDLRIDGLGVMLRPQETGSDLVTRRMVELEESPQLDNIRAGQMLELRCTIVAADASAAGWKVDALTARRAILRAVHRAAAHASRRPPGCEFASGETLTGVWRYSPRLMPPGGAGLGDSISIHQPAGDQWGRALTVLWRSSGSPTRCVASGNRPRPAGGDPNAGCRARPSDAAARRLRRETDASRHARGANRWEKSHGCHRAGAGWLGVHSAGARGR